MNNFVYHNATKIIFGRDTHKDVGKEVSKHAKKVLLHYGSLSIKANGVYDEVVTSLKSSGVDFIELSGVKPNPRLSLVYEGIEICKTNDIDFILAVGGGSVIDSAKAIALGSCHDCDVWDFFVNGKEAQNALPIGVVLTIPAAGSETSNGTVITNEDGWMKRPYGHQELGPKFAIMNPQICFTLPVYQVICGASDIMAHIMERYFTNTVNTDLTDRLCEATMKTVMNNVKKVLKNREDYNAWAEVMWAGTIAHNNLLGTGREEDWASHMIEHELSAMYDIAHGAGLSIVFPAWMKYVHKTNVKRFVQFAARVFDLDIANGNHEDIAMEGIEKLVSFYKEIGLPTKLSHAGIDDKDFEEMASKASKFGNLGNFKKLGHQDIVEIFILAL